MKKKVVVLMGGTSAERNVSLSSGKGITLALEKKGWSVIPIDTGLGRVLPRSELELLPHTSSTQVVAVKNEERAVDVVKMKEVKDTDVVFIALHGGIGEDGTLQALLDLVGVSYTGSGVLASALAMDKVMAKRVFIANGIPTPEWFLLSSKDSVQEYESSVDALGGYPVVVKPNDQGSTVGTTIVEKKSALGEAVECACRYSNEILVERYIPGREITVAVLGDEVLPIVEIEPENEMYDYECKYTKGKSKYTVPAKLSVEKTREIQELGLRAFRALKCSGFARVDLRLSPEGKPYCLELNTVPGMTETSLVPMAAKAVGIDFPELIERICELAAKKERKSRTARL
ncbi:MAG: D-alanine--D-alanine ligase [Candidatus Eisenbacteria bacterium]|nr:D-alanine--D-alanine ligase [Candidatus Eisenbacteria bacterium]